MASSQVVLVVNLLSALLCLYGLLRHTTVSLTTTDLAPILNIQMKDLLLQ